MANNNNNAKGVFFNEPYKDELKSWLVGQLNITSPEEFVKWLMEQPRDVKGGVPLQITKGKVKQGDRAREDFTSISLDTYRMEWLKKKAEENGGAAPSKKKAEPVEQDDDLPF